MGGALAITQMEGGAREFFPDYSHVSQGHTQAFQLCL